MRNTFFTTVYVIHVGAVWAGSAQASPDQPNLSVVSAKPKYNIGPKPNSFRSLIFLPFCHRLLLPPPFSPMAEAPEQRSSDHSDPPTPPQETIQKPKKNKRGRTKKPKRAAPAAAASAAPSSGAAMVEDPFLVLAGGKEGGNELNFSYCVEP